MEKTGLLADLDTDGKCDLSTSLEKAAHIIIDWVALESPSEEELEERTTNTFMELRELELMKMGARKSCVRKMLLP